MWQFKCYLHAFFSLSILVRSKSIVYAWVLEMDFCRIWCSFVFFFFFSFFFSFFYSFFFFFFLSFFSLLFLLSFSTKLWNGMNQNGGGVDVIVSIILYAFLLVRSLCSMDNKNPFTKLYPFFHLAHVHVPNRLHTCISTLSYVPYKIENWSRSKCGVVIEISLFAVKCMYH